MKIKQTQVKFSMHIICQLNSEKSSNWYTNTVKDIQIQNLTHLY